MKIGALFIMLLGPKKCYAPLLKLSSALQTEISCSNMSFITQYFSDSVAMHALLHDASATSHRLPQPTQEITDFQLLTHEPRRSDRTNRDSHTQRSHIHGIIMALEHTKVDVSQWRTMSKDMEVRKRSGCKKVPVGVFEAYVSLLDFVVLQFGHVIFIHWRLRHGLLEISKETIEKQYLSLVIKSFDVFWDTWLRTIHLMRHW